MKCSHVKVGNISAIVCGRDRIRTQSCVKCGRPADKLCDWKIPRVFENPGISGARPKPATCDVPVCSACTFSPATDKDLCPDHAAAWKAHPKNQTGEAT